MLIQQAASYEHLKDLTVLRSIGETLESQSLWVLPCSVAWSTVAELFAKGVHRILVAMDANVHIDNLGVIKAAEYQVMTQMDVMRFWWTHIQTSGLLADALKSTAASELMSKNVKMARDSDKVWPTLKDMSSHSLQAIPIVGTQSGKLLGALTLSDMKGFLLNLPDADVGTLGHDFGSTPLSDLVPRLLGPSWMDDWLKQHTVKPTDSLFKVLETLIQGKLHQVWVTTGHQEAPTGVITLSDLMRFLHQNQSKA